MKIHEIFTGLSVFSFCFAIVLLKYSHYILYLNKTLNRTLFTDENAFIHRIKVGTLLLISGAFLIVLGYRLV